MTTTIEARVLVSLAATGTRPRLAMALMAYSKKVKALGRARDTYVGPDPRGEMDRAAKEVRAARVEVAQCLDADESADIVHETIQSWMVSQ